MSKPKRPDPIDLMVVDRRRNSLDGQHRIEVVRRIFKEMSDAETEPKPDGDEG